MMHKAWRCIGEVPYNFLRSFIKFQGHMEWKTDNLYPIWVRLPGRSQLSNPRDLPCLSKINIWDVNCAQATAFILNTWMYVLVKVSVFETETVSTCGGLKHPTFGFMPNALTIWVIGPDICCPMLLNTGSGCRDMIIIELNMIEEERRVATAAG